MRTSDREKEIDAQIDNQNKLVGLTIAWCGLFCLALYAIG